MGMGAGSRDGSSVWVRAASAAVCILVLVVTAGLGPISSSDAKKGKRPQAPRAAGYPPAASTGAFGMDLLRELPPPNVVLSPDSVSAALAMTGMGAVGRTAEEMARTLRLKGPANLAAVGDLQRAILAGHAAAGVGDPEPPTLEIANGLFLQAGMAYEPAFLAGTQQRFGAEPITVDYINDLPGALETINQWVSDRTHGRIPQILDSLPPGMALALANAIYFDGDWEHEFEVSNTKPGTFYGTGGKGTAQLMNQTRSFRYGAGRGYRAVSLPYRSSTLSMVVVLPERQRLGALQRQLGGKALGQLARRLRPTEVNLSLPRFHLNTAVELKGLLQRLGMRTPFDLSADFSRITGSADLMIDSVTHAADITVDEKGTVAAAATVVKMIKKSKRKEPVVFKVNRPFLFFLRDDQTGAVLFAGRITQPPADAQPRRSP